MKIDRSYILNFDAFCKLRNDYYDYLNDNASIIEVAVAIAPYLDTLVRSLQRDLGTGAIATCPLCQVVEKDCNRCVWVITTHTYARACVNTSYLSCLMKNEDFVGKVEARIREMDQTMEIFYNLDGDDDDEDNT